MEKKVAGADGHLKEYQCGSAHSSVQLGKGIEPRLSGSLIAPIKYSRKVFFFLARGDIFQFRVLGGEPTVASRDFCVRARSKSSISENPFKFAQVRRRRKKVSGAESVIHSLVCANLVH